MITNKYEAKVIYKTYFMFNASSIVQYVIQIKNGIIKHVKLIVNAKKIIVGFLAHAFVRAVNT